MGHTYAQLDAGFGIGTTTAHRYVAEAVELLAALAPGLTDTVRTASAKAYLILDGTLLPIDRIAADRPFYSGKHRKHGMNVQIIADPFGRLLWASPALPGAVHDIRAAREHRIVDALAEAGTPCWADKGIPRRRRIMLGTMGTGKTGTRPGTAQRSRNPPDTTALNGAVGGNRRPSERRGCQVNPPEPAARCRTPDGRVRTVGLGRLDEHGRHYVLGRLKRTSSAAASTSAPPKSNTHRAHIRSGRRGLRLGARPGPGRTAVRLRRAGHRRARPFAARSHHPPAGPWPGPPQASRAASRRERHLGPTGKVCCRTPTARAIRSMIPSRSEACPRDSERAAGPS